MFGGYKALPQRDSSAPRTPGPGLFADTHRLTPRTFDYIPNVSHNDFTDTSQGWLSWICNLVVIFLVHLCTFITFPITGWFVLKTVPNYQRMVVFRLGRVCPPKGPGIVLVLPLIDQWQKVDLRTRAFNIPPCGSGGSLLNVTVECNKRLGSIKVSTRDGGVLSVGADIQFRIWNPVLSVVSVQDLNASTRMTAHNALTHSLAKKTAREIQSDRLKLGEYLGMDINEMTQPWGLEVDRVELTIGSLLKAPEENHPGSASLIMPPSVPGLEGVTGPIQQLAMHFLNRGGDSRPPPGDSVTFTDELRGAPRVTSTPGSVEELLSTVKLLLSEALVSRVGATFQFDIGSGDGQRHSYYLDLSRGSGAVGAGSMFRDPDVALSLSDTDLLSMFRGELTPFAAYTCGRLQLQGDVSTALKLEELIKLLKTQ